MDKNIEKIRGLLVEIFINNEPDDLISKLFEFEDKYINEAYKKQNSMLNESISTEKENSEARNSHLNFYYHFNKWYLEFAEKNTIIYGENK